MPVIQEGLVKIHMAEGKISKDLDVFYNPVMQFNRDLSILLLKSIENKNMQICDLLAGTGIRSLRFLKELPQNKINSIFINDKNTEFLQLMKKQFSLNNMRAKPSIFSDDTHFKYIIKKEHNSENKKLVLKHKVNICNLDANLLLLKSNGFDYIDIDPFGSPNPFLDASIKMLSRNGILAVTATDTAALAGTSLNAGKRKYWSVGLHNELMHEMGVRILIRKVQLIGAQYDKALIPILSFAKDHYYRITFRCIKGKEAVDEQLKQHAYFVYEKNMHFYVSQFPKPNLLSAGPLFTGKLCDEKLLQTMKKNAKEKNLNKFLDTLLQETKMNQVGFYSLHVIAKSYKLSQLPTTDSVLKALRKKYFASQTIFDPVGIKTNAPIAEIVKILRN